MIRAGIEHKLIDEYPVQQISSGKADETIATRIAVLLRKSRQTRQQLQHALNELKTTCQQSREAREGGRTAESSRYFAVNGSTDRSLKDVPPEIPGTDSAQFPRAQVPPQTDASPE